MSAIRQSINKQTSENENERKKKQNQEKEEEEEITCIQRKLNVSFVLEKLFSLEIRLCAANEL